MPGFVALTLAANSAQVVLLPLLAGGLWWITASERLIGRRTPQPLVGERGDGAAVRAGDLFRVPRGPRSGRPSVMTTSSQLPVMTLSKSLHRGGRRARREQPY